MPWHRPGTARGGGLAPLPAGAAPAAVADRGATTDNCPLGPPVARPVRRAVPVDRERGRAIAAWSSAAPARRRGCPRVARDREERE